MKKYLLTIAIVLTFLASYISPASAAIGDVGVGVGVGLGAAATLPQEGSWITDNEVTKIGKNAVRSGNLLDWTLQDYQWASSSAQQYSTSSLVSFWLTIQRIVYALFLFVVLITAFMLIITRGRSLSAKRFLPRFFLVVLLVTFSFSLVQFLYQIVDIFQGFFLKNPQGNIISSKDLLYIGFDYKNFQGIRVFGASYDESALMSLLLVKLTAFTYYVMAILLIFRKIILWFLIIISPVFPLLLLFYPLRNTAKIWIGEFFRWLLYAPLFAIFLSGLVKLWQSPFGLPLLFNFTGEGTKEVYPTAVNILLGGPGRTVALHNSVNLPDTFALYLVALLMLWVVIILPFILLQIFLDNLMAFNYKDNPLMKQMFTFMNARAPLPPKPPIVPFGPPAPAGIARSIPFGRHMQIPDLANLAKNIPAVSSQQQAVPRSIFQRVNKQAEVMNLTNLSIPTMRDIARFEKAKLSKDTKLQQEIQRTRQTLVQVANPATALTSVERDRFKQIREKLVTQVREGNQVASTVLNAANTYNNYSTQSSATSTVNSLTNLIKNIAHPALVSSKRESEKITQVKEQLTQAAAQGNQFAQNVLSSVNSFSSSQVTQIQQLLQNIADPGKVIDSKQRESYVSLREKIVQAEKSGNPLATLITSSLEKSTSQEQVKAIQDQLLQAAARGEPLAAELLTKSSISSLTTEKDTIKLQSTLESAAKGGDPLATTLLQMLLSEKKSVQVAPVDAKTKLKAGVFPVVNRIQQVSLDDYEAVKKMWKENYKNLSVPETAGQMTRKQWVTGEIADIQKTISLLSSINSQDVEEGMKHVSDILPFLLIGGFSQTEIIAYLKAKMEAGKSILEDGEINEEEDMLLSAKKSADKVLGHLSATTEATMSPQDYSGVPTEVRTKTYATSTQTDSPTEMRDERAISSTLSALLKTVNLPVLTLRDVVRMETASTAEEQQKREQIRSALSKIASASSISSNEEKEQFSALHEELVSESKKGNALATHILQASEQLESSLSELQATESAVFIKTLQDIVTPEQIADDSVKSEYVKVNQQLLASRQKAEPFAINLLATMDKIKISQATQLTEFLQKLSNPTSLTTASEQMHYNKLVERIAQASENQNVTASQILRATREELSQENVMKLSNLIRSEALKGDQLAAYIAESVYPHANVPASDMGTLYQQLQQEKSKGSVLATSILRLLAKQKKSELSGLRTPSGLPKQNRLQQVSLEDYETVKKMWTDNYASSTLDSSQPMTREQWIKQDMDTITKSINLLSSSNPDEQAQGMEQVGDILPFLLLGGFSQTEVIGYLKAKLEAGKIVLQDLEKDSQSAVFVPAHSSQAPSTQTVHTEASMNQGDLSQQIQHDTQAGQQSESLLNQLGLLPPTLREIVAYEAGLRSGKDSGSNEQIGATLKVLAGLGQPQSSQDRDRQEKIHHILETQAQAGDTTASMLLSGAGRSAPEIGKEDELSSFITTLRMILDPSLVSSPDEQMRLRTARELLMKERQDENGVAVSTMKLIDKISHRETESVVKLLQNIDSPARIVDDKQREIYISLKTDLEKERETNTVAASILQALHADITPISANKIRVQLIEASMQGDQLATKLRKEYVTLPKETLQEARMLYQQLTAKSEDDPFVKLLLTLVKDGNKRTFSRPGGVMLPKQNRLQQVSIDDYEAVRRMLYDMFLHCDVPKTNTGEQQTREEWVTSEKASTEKALSLLSSDVPENVKKGLEQVKDVLPFLLLGGFSHNEVLEYLKAKSAAAVQALQTLSEGDEQEESRVSGKAVSNQKTMTPAKEDDDIKE